MRIEYIFRITILLIFVCSCVEANSQDYFKGSIIETIKYSCDDKSMLEQRICQSGDSTVTFIDGYKIRSIVYLKGIKIRDFYRKSATDYVVREVMRPNLKYIIYEDDNSPDTVQCKLIKDKKSGNYITAVIAGRNCIQAKANWRSGHSVTCFLDTTMKQCYSNYLPYHSLKEFNEGSSCNSITEAVEVKEFQPNSMLFEYPDLPIDTIQFKPETRIIRVDYPQASMDDNELQIFLYEHSYARLSSDFLEAGKFRESIFFGTVGIYQGCESMRKWASYNRGLAYLQIFEVDSGCSDLKKSKLLGNPSADKTFAKYCNDNGRIEILSLKLKQLISDKKYYEAIQIFDQVLSIHPDDTLALYNRAVSKYNSGDRIGSCDDINKAILKGANGKDYKSEDFCSTNDLMIAYYQSGMTALSKNDYKIAEEYFTYVLITFPESGAAYYRRGLANLQQGKKMEAKSDFTKAVEFGVDEAQEKLNEITE